MPEHQTDGESKEGKHRCAIVPLMETKAAVLILPEKPRAHDE